ncbi:MAG: DUF115 domain-containing protein [Spirochaetes bacterium]|nr:DUF115 domain-containing protein [Spirochaetota bacterium]
MSAVNVHRARDGAPVFELEVGEGRFFLSSRIAPIEEARRMLAEEPDLEVHIIIVFGAGHVPLIEQAALRHPGARLAVVEPEEALRLEVSRSLSPALAGRLAWVTVQFRQELPPLFLEGAARSVRFLYNRTEARLFPAFFEEVRQEIIRLHDRKSINVNTLGRFERLWLRNLTRNSPEIVYAGGMGAVGDLGRGARAVLVAAGPSLAADLPVLRRLQDRAVILAVDTAYKTLLRHGIQPDGVVVVDPQKVNSRYVEGMGADEDGETIFIAEPAICPMGLRGRRGRVLMFNTIFPWFHHLASAFGDKGELDLGGSVATSAFDFCRRAGFDETLILGLDLCFSRDTYHVPGTHYESQWFASVHRKKTWEMLTFKLLDYGACTPAENERGERVFLDSRFTLYRNWFEQRLGVPELSARFRGGMKGVARLAGLEYVETEAWLAARPPSPEGKAAFRNAALEACRRQGAPGREAWDRFVESTREILLHLDRFTKTAREALRESEEGLRRLRRGGDPTGALRRLERLDRELGADFHGKALVNIAVQKVIHRIEAGSNAPTERKGKPEEGPLADSCDLYREMAEVAELNVVCIRRALGSMGEAFGFGAETRAPAV